MQLHHVAGRAVAELPTPGPRWGQSTVEGDFSSQKWGRTYLEGLEGDRFGCSVEIIFPTIRFCNSPSSDMVEQPCCTVRFMWCQSGGTALSRPHMAAHP